MKKYFQYAFCILIFTFLTGNISGSFATTVGGHSTVVSAKMFMSDNPVALLSSNSSERPLIISSTVSHDAVCLAQTLTMSNFPISMTENGSLELTRSTPIVDANSEIWTGNVRIATPEIHSFYGKIQGEKDSKVFVSFVNGEMYGNIDRGDGLNFTLAPTVASQSTKREHLLVNTAQYKAQQNNGTPNAMNHCGMKEPTSEEIENIKSMVKSSKDNNKMLASTTLLQANGAVDVAADVYHRFGNDVNRETAYFIAMYALVSRIYEDEINVVIYFPYMHFYTDDDPEPYVNTSKADGLKVPNTLDEMPNIWKSRGISRSFAQVATMPPNVSGGYVAGIARLSGLCDNSSGFSVITVFGSYTFPTLAYTEDVETAAHEIGHLFGSPHTHQCGVWGASPIDTCVTKDQTSDAYAGDACFNTTPKNIANGTIMSYCHLLHGSVLMTFGPKPISVMRAKSESSSCIKAPTSTAVLIQYPVGNQTIAANNPLGIRWTSSKVTNVTLEYSTNAGTTWNVIATRPATDRVYQWMVPAISSTKMLVRLYDATNSAVGDTCLTTFAVSVPTLALSYPTGGEQVAQGSTLTVIWSSSLIDSVNVYYSTDNGANWITLKTGLKAIPNSFDWITPSALSSKQVLIKVVNAANNSLVSQSSAFAIGSPKVSALISPNGGETWMVGTVQKIKWQSEFVAQIKLQYSTDGGATWKKIVGLSGNTDATPGEYSWTIPPYPTTKAIVKIQNAADASSPVYQSLANFTISPIDGIADQPHVVSSTSMEIDPSPVSEFGWIRFTLSSFAKQVNISLRDVTGRIITQISSMQSVSEGEHATELDVQTLAQGVYFVVLEADGVRAVKPITVIR